VPPAADRASYLTAFDRTLSLDGKALVAEVVVPMSASTTAPVLTIDSTRSAIDSGRDNGAPRGGVRNQ